MELSHEEQGPPSRGAVPKGRGNRIAKYDEAACVEGAQDTPDDVLSILEAEDGDERLADTRQQDGPDEGPGYGPGEGEVIIDAGEALANVTGRGAVDEDVVGGLEVEGLLDFGVW